MTRQTLLCILEQTLGVLDMKFQITDDIELRVLQPQDASILFELINQNRLYLRKWLPWLDQNTTVEHSRSFINTIENQSQAGKGFACGVFYESDLVGMCGFHETDFVNQSIAIGYWLAEGFQGKGIITRCTKFFLNYAFEELELNKVLIPVAVENNKSRAICERLGFASEGIEPNAEFLYEKYVDHIRYSITRDRWLDMRDSMGEHKLR